MSGRARLIPWGWRKVSNENRVEMKGGRRDGALLTLRIRLDLGEVSSSQEELLCLQGKPLTPTSELSQTLLEPRPDHRVCSQPNSPFFIALERARVRVWILAGPGEPLSVGGVTSRAISSFPGGGGRTGGSLPGHSDRPLGIR